MYETIVAATDGSDHAKATVGHAVELARAVGATLHVVTVVETRGNPMKFGIGEIDELNEAAIDLVEGIAEANSDIDIEGEVRRGKPATVLLGYASEVDADLLVVGQSGTDGIEAAVLGSTTDRLARLTDIPLTIVPLPDDTDG